ncbi:MAG: 6-oxocyclohex-1-ene-1-carbonyl-CoA hydratase [Deltaproteobacteria bacterium]|nr:6-oxocyclohex-1-ene-1-carbonyl-CoA hydratase [Deltaproteobacteria bacterium]
MTTFDFRNHEIDANYRLTDVAYELHACKDNAGRPVDGLYAAWVILNNPKEMNAYTTRMIKDVIVALRRAATARDVVAVVLTGAGDRAFCAGGNTREYAEYYAGRPEEYRQYMRLFNDMVTSVLTCDKPVICRVNGVRVGGGQEVGMACDYTIASDLATFGQAGPRHGSAPIGGATDFLPLFVGVENAMLSCTACEPWSAYKAHRLGLITDVVPVLKVNGAFVRNPRVVTDRWIDDGRIVYGELKTGDEARAALDVVKAGTIDFSRLDARVDALVTSLMNTFPGCLTKTVEAIRTHKLFHWDRNRESARAWLGLNMLTEANAGFRAFNEGPKDAREVDFVRLRKKLAAGEKWSDTLIDSVLPKGGDAK